VLFEFNRTGLTPEAKRSLSPVVSILNGGSNQKVTIQGYTDSVGSDAYNQVLSQKRSESVKGFLVQSGVSADQITARGFGEANPVASNDTDEGRRLNRRVDVIVSEGERTAAAAARDP
jgi:OOP family OmpA-OmpF porin